MFYDVAVIGAGVVGGLIARELSKFNIKTVLLEKCNDMAMGTTKANSAIVHAGFDSKPGSLKAQLNVKGSEAMESLCAKLAVPYKRTGSFVIAFGEEQLATLEELLERGKANGVKGLEIISRERLRQMEPNISSEALAALWAPTAALVSPYELNIAAVENAVVNGVEFRRNFDVVKIGRAADGAYELAPARGDNVRAKYIINAAGVESDDIAAMLGDTMCGKIIPSKGEYLLCDKNCGTLVSHIIFQCPNEMGKGVLVTPTVHGNLLIGPNAIDIEEKDDISTTMQGIHETLEKGRRSVPAVGTKDVITSFAGIRAHAKCDDFIIRRSEGSANAINVVGIESPGLSAAPAIAELVRSMFEEMAGELKPNPSFNPVRPTPVRFDVLDNEQRRRLIEKDKAYGRIICRCESVTEGEILDAIRAPAGAVDVDGVKRRTRAGMGRCQGGFCGSKVVEILARELGVEIDQITKFGGGSLILSGKSK